ncbi:MAG: 2-dehydropantoate 2-reductase [Clostridia bacterium]|nr:2-dehydropantoate 2-reductase [Clostridia bacterium]
MKVLVIGLGALGSVYSCLLKNKGHRVAALVREPMVEVIQNQGVSITGIWGDHETKLDEVVSDLTSLEKVFDLILLTVKSFDTGKMAQEISHLITPSTYVVLLQNGYGNSALNPLGALFGVNYGKLAEVEHTRLLLESIITEIFELLAVSGQETLWPDAPTYLRDFYGKMVPTTAAHHASMLQDIQKGRRTEIDALNGAVVQLGRKYNLRLPVNEVVTAMIKAKEQFINAR